MSVFIIDNERIEHENLAPWARELSPDAPDWQKMLARLLIDWFDDSAVLNAHTSGSTGQPKVIPLSKSFMITSAQMTAKEFDLGAGANALMCLSANYIAGKMMAIRALVNEWDLYVVEPSTTIAAPKERIHFSAMVPMQVINLLKTNRNFFKRLETLIIGGAPVSRELEENLYNVSTQCWETYGMTETSTHVARRSIGQSKQFQSLGDFTFDLSDSGCLVVNHPLIEPQSTRDLVQLDSDRSFIWLGRLDNVINSGGLKISPENLEQKIQTLITTRFFIGSSPHDILGEQITLFIEGAKDATWGDLDKVNDQLKRFEQIRNVIFVKQFDETGSGKIIRKAYS